MTMTMSVHVLDSGPDTEPTQRREPVRSARKLFVSTWLALTSHETHLLFLWLGKTKLLRSNPNLAVRMSNIDRVVENIRKATKGFGTDEKLLIDSVFFRPSHDMFQPFLILIITAVMIIS